ncbi:ATP synthase F0 subunit B [Deltaproteobacteria bacterium]|nr:ATP synthase F0 subunit B [Deltaproteobacteria bacterium]
MNNRRNLLKLFCITFVIVFFFLMRSDSFAMEGTSTARKIWDNVMLWVNFGILVFLFMKFGKKPLMDFLLGERKKIEEKIDTIGDQVKKAKSLMEAEADKLAGIDERIKEMWEYIVEVGKKVKEKTINKAELTARRMIDDAKNEAHYKLEIAKKRFGEEMLDMAISLAVKEMKKGVSEEDHEKIVNQFTIGLSNEKTRFA